MMLKLLLFYALTVVPALSETLLSGAIYFDSKNTLLEVQDFIKSGDTNALALLVKGNHISEKVTADQEVILLVSGSDAGSPVEFRFVNDPTTYWTYARYIAINVVKAAPMVTPALTPGPNSTLPANLPSSLTATALSAVIPLPSPSPAPFRPVSTARAGEPEKQDAEHPPLIKHHHQVANDEQEKIWHLVNGHWKWYDKRRSPEVRRAKGWFLVDGHWRWYDKRKLHEVRRALPASGAPVATAPTATPVPAPTPYVVH